MSHWLWDQSNDNPVRILHSPISAWLPETGCRMHNKVSFLMENTFSYISLKQVTGYIIGLLFSCHLPLKSFRFWCTPYKFLLFDFRASNCAQSLGGCWVTWSQRLKLFKYIISWISALHNQVMFISLHFLNKNINVVPAQNHGKAYTK